MPLFVVHKHQATHLHWDFRLELDGVLKSWAVPKEPSMDPAVKRLAIQVDDHDLSYGKFEGEIAEGYGKGTVEIWDKGTYTLVNRKESKLIINLKGKKLKGKFVLLKFAKAGKNQWLLFKKKEE
ncbi:MAG: DNA polymerase ligase N-terminal domain-containing protein [Nanoarchaeota archaeon]